MALALSGAAIAGPSVPKRGGEQPKASELPRREAAVPFAEIREALAAGRYHDARLLIDAELKKKQTDADAGGLHLLRAVADASLGDVAGLRADATETLRLLGESVLALTTLMELGLQASPDLALDSFERLAAINPGIARQIDEGAVWHLGQQFEQGGRREEYNRLVLVLADLSHGIVRPVDEVRKEAAQILIERGKIEPALAHARKVKSRETLIDILTDRRFERIWPELEASSGERLEIPAKAQLAAAQTEFAANPESTALRLSLMRAYVDIGQLVEAEQLGSVAGRTLEELMALTETTAYVVDLHANILAMLGRHEEADHRRRALISTWTPDRRWVINMAINRIGGLFIAQKYEDVLEELDRPDNRYQRDSSAYAKQLLRVLRIASLHQLGRGAEVMRLLAELRAHVADAPAATAEALVIIGRDHDAEEVVLTYLKDPNQRTSVLESLRIADSAPKAEHPFEAELDARFRRRAAVEAAFQRYGRDLPEKLRRVF